MAYSSQKELGNGVTTDFNVAFSYLDMDHVKVRVDKVFTTELGSPYKMTWMNSTTIRVDGVSDNLPAPIGAEIEFIRQTPINVPVVVFGGGASLSSENLNKNSEYLTFALQEASDTNQEFTKLYLGLYDVFPETDNDGDPLQVGAVIYYRPETALYYYAGGGQWIIGESTVAAQTFATAALASEQAAATSEAAALASQNAAAASQAAALASQNAASSSETNASTSETAVASSASAAAASQSAAGASEAAAAGSAAASATSASEAAASESAAASSASASDTSRIAAATSETNAAGLASAAATSEANAATSESNAAGSVTTASQQAAIATDAASALTREIFVSSSGPSGGADGDIWFQY